MTTRTAAGTMALFAALGACTKPSEPSGSPEASTPAVVACAPGTQRDADGGCEVTPAPEPEPSAEEEAEAPPPPGKCPSPTNLPGLYAMVWSKQFPLSPDVAARAKGIAGTAAETKALANDVETELRASCTKMAAELGVKEAFASSTLACGAASTALKQLREKLGKAKIKVVSHAASCTAPIESFGTCLSKCDGVLDASAPEVSCQGGAAVGKCTGICEGACDPQPAGKCSGTCTGACETGFHGTCKSACKGTCNGKEIKPGAGGLFTEICTGTCDGSCEDGRGECKGSCQGGCETHAEVCNGTCLGKCSVDLKDVRCTGPFKAVGTPDECRAYCETRADRHLTCSGAYVVVAIEGAKDAAAAKAYESALEHHLPTIAKIAHTLEPRLRGAQGNVKLVTTGVKTLTQASDSEEIRAVTPCLSGFVQTVTEGSVALKTATAAAGAVLAAAK